MGKSQREKIKEAISWWQDDENYLLALQDQVAFERKRVADSWRKLRAERRRQWQSDPVRPEQYAYRTSIAPIVIKYLKKRCGGKCERCGVKTRLEMHHRHYRSLGYECPRDISMLCRDCHQHQHRGYQWNPEVNKPFIGGW